MIPFPSASLEVKGLILRLETTVPLVKQFRYKSAQKDRTLIHPTLRQPTQRDEVTKYKTFHAKQQKATDGAHEEEGNNVISSGVVNDDDDDGPATEIESSRDHFSFVVCADTQIGMTSQNKEWDTELGYSRDAILKINAMEPKPLFVSICGDLVDMEWTFNANDRTGWTKEDCDKIQDQQNKDFQETWSILDESIPLVCLCGNHDVGNRPTKASIDRFTSAFGDDYLAFWVNGSYNIVLNSALFSNPDEAIGLYNEQLAWLEDRLIYATGHFANHIFVFGHHPWFLYSEDEESDDLIEGGSAYPIEWGKSDVMFPDSYFSIQKSTRCFKSMVCPPVSVGTFTKTLYQKQALECN